MDKASIDKISNDVRRLKFFAAVTTGRLPAPPSAFIPVGGTPWTLEDLPTTNAAYNCGHVQGFQSAIGGHFETPVPPVGLCKRRLMAFHQGVLAGEMLAQEARAAGVGSDRIFDDPFDDLPQYTERR